MKAIGKNINGEEVEIKIYNKSVYCPYNLLTELFLPNGVDTVYCFKNQLTALHLPNGVKDFDCSSNHLTELFLPNGVKDVDCSNNPIKEITLPNSIIYATLPLNCNVLNIDDFKNRTDITIRFV